MPAKPSHAASLKQLKAFGLSLPGAQPKSPWPGHEDVAVSDKTFAYLGLHDDGGLKVSIKLPVSGKAVLASHPGAVPTAYGLGKSGWVSTSFAPAEPVPLETVKRWMMESYRAQAPKRVLKALEEAQPWVKAGELPDVGRR